MSTSRKSLRVEGLHDFALLTCMLESFSITLFILSERLACFHLLELLLEVIFY